MFCTLYKNYHNLVGSMTLSQIYAEVISDKYKTTVERIRALKREGKKDEADRLKITLPAFTFSSTFKDGRRGIKFADKYNGVVCLDFDHVPPEKVKPALELICGISFTRVCFVSPSGEGLKVFAEVNTGAEHHKRAYGKVKAYYEEALKDLGLVADPSGKDVARLCYMSWSPEACYHPDFEVFEVDLSAPAIQKEEKPFSGSPPRVKEAKKQKAVSERVPAAPVKGENPFDTLTHFEATVSFTDKEALRKGKAGYEEGNRNNHVYWVACNCNKKGISESYTEERCIERYSGLPEDFPEEEIRQAVHSAYSQHREEHGKGVFGQKVEAPSLPRFPACIYEKMPHFFKRIAEQGLTEEEKDILTLGGLTVFSAGLPTIWGMYSRKELYANLYFFISAEPASGKGILEDCLSLAEPIHQKLIDETEEKREAVKRVKSRQERQYALEQIPQKLLFFSGNNTSAGFMQNLADNEEDGGLMFETEADTLTQSLGSERRSFSDLLRKAFHHEEVSSNRKTGREYIRVKRPRLSLLLTGTPEQIKSLIHAVENGLYSRFGFYIMDGKQPFKNPFASSSEKSARTYFEELGEEFLALYEGLKEIPPGQEEPHKIRFSLTPAQEKGFDGTFAAEHDYYQEEERHIVPSIRRLGVTAFRIMMVFSASRIMEEGEGRAVWKDPETKTQLVCRDDDFENAMDIVKVLLEHALCVFSEISGGEIHVRGKKERKKEQFLENLKDAPSVFTRNDCLHATSGLRISDTTMGRYLGEFVEEKFLLHDHNRYEKVYDCPRKVWGADPRENATNTTDTGESRGTEKPKNNTGNVWDAERGSEKPKNNTGNVWDAWNAENATATLVTWSQAFLEGLRIEREATGEGFNAEEAEEDERQYALQMRALGFDTW
ncbi:MAG: hypothetical protein CRN43_01920 [Candidatus Nephrothrix sp. EaCA]|nr:MAG: hypothetical protein CRN43_01920 [Candidatus Nephrothrix sp. EaCA]